MLHKKGKKRAVEDLGGGGGGVRTPPQFWKINYTDTPQLLK